MALITNPPLIFSYYEMFKKNQCTRISHYITLAFKIHTEIEVFISIKQYHFYFDHWRTLFTAWTIIIGIRNHHCKPSSSIARFTVLRHSLLIFLRRSSLIHLVLGLPFLFFFLSSPFFVLDSIILCIFDKCWLRCLGQLSRMPSVYIS